MLDETTPAEESATTTPAAETEAAPAKKAAAKRTAAARKTTAKKTTTNRTTAKKAAAEPAGPAPESAETGEAAVTDDPAPAKKTAAKKTAAKKTAAKKTAAKKSTTKKTAAKKATAKTVVEPGAETVEEPGATAEAHAGEVPADATAAAVVEDAAAATVETTPEIPAKKTAKKAAAKKTTAKKAAAKKATAKKAPARKAAAPEVSEAATEQSDLESEVDADVETDAGAPGTVPLFQAPEPVKKAPARRTRKKAVAPVEEPTAALDESEAPSEDADVEDAGAVAADATAATADETDETAVPEAAAESGDDTDDAGDDTGEDSGEDAGDDSGDDEESGEGTPRRRRRRRGGRRRRRSGGSGDDSDSGDDTGTEGDSNDAAESDTSDSEDDSTESETSSEGTSSSSRRRRRRRRAGDNDADAGDDPENTVTRVRKGRTAEDQITALAGSTRLEAKKQRRREGREAGRRRAPIVSEAEFLARREAVERVMVIRQREDLTQIAVLEDKVLVEHYVARESQTSLIGNVYLGRVQNVLPSMEAAFIDIGKGRNAVLYAGEVNWSALGHKDGQPRKIESVLSPGQSVLVQVTKDPVGHKGARLTSQVSLAGRFLVYVPDGTTSGISRKLPDTERARLKSLLKEIVPESAGVIVRTAAEGASEEELTSDVERLKARWEDIEAKRKGNAPQLLYGEPDLTLKVVRDLFTEDFTKLVIEGDDAWQTVSGYVEHVAPDLADRLEQYAPADNASAQQGDVFSVHRIDEQIAKALDRKVWLPSGGSLIIDRTEAMTVVDVNTGKFTGSGGNLEETVTKNNLEAAEEIVRQLRLRDIGGIIVVDFIDMVLEANRDLVVRRLVECLGRDRTRHQVAEVTSLGLVQMTRKRIGTGLLETFSTDCEHCNGRGLVTHSHPVDGKSGGGDDEGRGRGRRGRGRGNASSAGSGGGDRQDRGRGRQTDSPAPVPTPPTVPTPADVAAVARPDNEPIIAPEDVQDLQQDSQQDSVRESSEKPAAESATKRVEKAAEPVVKAAPGAPADAEPVDTTPRVMTRTRARRGASRPTTVTTPVVVVEAPEAAPAPAAPVEAPAKPKVVTRTRGGSRKS